MNDVLILSFEISQEAFGMDRSEDCDHLHAKEALSRLKHFLTISTFHGF